MKPSVKYPKGKRPDLMGQRFSAWVIIGMADPIKKDGHKGHSRWLCRCNCGVEKVILQTNLLRGYLRAVGVWAETRLITKVIPNYISIGKI